ncbi:LysM peptidoglycan-binding domain-containing protein [Moorella sulfitireducens]|nr:LysM domain-containing protein [Moorella sulfitireducens]
MIAQRHGISLNALVAANPHIADPDRIQVGLPVCIPG